MQDLSYVEIILSPQRLGRGDVLVFCIVSFCCVLRLQSVDTDNLFNYVEIAVKHRLKVPTTLSSHWHCLKTVSFSWYALPVGQILGHTDDLLY